MLFLIFSIINILNFIDQFYSFFLRRGIYYLKITISLAGDVITIGLLTFITN